MATIGDIVTINAEQQADHEARKIRKREQKQRERERAREKTRLLIVAEMERIERDAARKEIIDETFVSRVLRHPVLTPGGYMLVGARIEVAAGRPARIDPVLALKLTERQRRAARQIQTDWREVGAGLNVGAVDYLRSGGGGDGSGGHGAMRRQIDTRARLDAAMAFLGAFAPLVAKVVLDCIPPKVWAYQEGRPVEDAGRWVAAALDRLALFYWPPREDGVSRECILTIGPPRSAYDLSVPEDGC